MATELEIRLRNILQEKENKIKPENIKKDITIFGISGILDSGIDTSDATALSSDITKNKTAYVNGEKITGTAPIINTTYETITDSVQLVSLKNIDARLTCVVGNYNITLQNSILKATSLVDNSTCEIECTLSDTYLSIDAGCVDYFAKDTMVIIASGYKQGYIYLFDYKNMIITYKNGISASNHEVNGIYYPAINPHRPYVSLSLGMYGNTGSPGTNIFKINDDFTLTFIIKNKYINKSSSSAIYIQMDRWLNDYMFDIVNESGYSSDSLGKEIYTNEANVCTRYFLDDETVVTPTDYQYLLTANSANNFACYRTTVSIDGTTQYKYSIKVISKDSSGTINTGNEVAFILSKNKVQARFIADDIILIGSILYKLTENNLDELQAIEGAINHVNRYNSLILNGNTLNWFLTNGVERLSYIYYDNAKLLNNTDDANALETDIKLGKTAYVNGKKIVGSYIENAAPEATELLENWENIEVVKYGLGVSGITYRLECNKLEGPVYLDENSVIELSYGELQLAEYIGLTPDKIKAGETILGIEGTYTGE